MDSANKYVHERLVELKQGNASTAHPLCEFLGPILYIRGRKQKLNHEDAEEVVQETLFRIVDKVNLYQEKEAGGLGWVNRIFDRIVIDRKRKSYNLQGRETSLNKLLEVSDELSEASFEGSNRKAHVLDIE